MSLVNDSELGGGACATMLFKDDEDARIILEQVSSDEMPTLKSEAIHRATKTVVDSGGSSTDLHAIRAQLQLQQGVGKEILVSDLMKIIQDIPVFRDMTASIARIKELSRLRKLQELGAEIQRRVSSDPEGVTAYIQDTISDIGTGSEAFQPLHPSKTAYTGRLLCKPEQAVFIVTILAGHF